MRILALNTYHGGSHQAFLDGWINHSRHEFELLTLPAYKWKWRMRHAPLTFAEQLAAQQVEANSFDALFCTDMLNLAEFRGLACDAVRGLPSVVYFHENQLTYPNRSNSERDLHFAFTNVTTCLAAKTVWFNSAFHRDSFLDAVASWMQRMPDFKLEDAADNIRRKSAVLSPGIDAAGRTSQHASGPLQIVWVSRWEHDKDPQTFFAALVALQWLGIDFRLSVLGESYGNVPECFAEAEQRFASHIDHWGYATSREAYVERLHQADVVVSTAQHEFFGIGILEAVAAGCFPLVPRQLAYPEVLGDNNDFFHDGTATGIAKRLCELSHTLAHRDGERGSDAFSSEIAAKHAWPIAAGNLDRAIESLI